MYMDIKMIVTPEQSAEVQKIFFANGGSHIDGSKEVANVHYSMIFIDRNNNISFLDGHGYNSEEDIDIFNEHSFTKVDPDFFICTNGTCREIVSEVIDRNEVSFDCIPKRIGNTLTKFKATALVNEIIATAICGINTVATKSAIAYAIAKNTDMDEADVSVSIHQIDNILTIKIVVDQYNDNSWNTWLPTITILNPNGEPGCYGIKDIIKWLSVHNYEEVEEVEESEEIYVVSYL